MTDDLNRLDQSPFILTINGGSSSIKFALFRTVDPSAPVTRGMIDRIGLPNSEMLVTDAATQQCWAEWTHWFSVPESVNMLPRFERVAAPDWNFWASSSTNPPMKLINRSFHPKIVERGGA